MWSLLKRPETTSDSCMTWRDVSHCIRSLLKRQRFDQFMPLIISTHIYLQLQYKLCRVKKVSVGPKGIPFIVTHDGRTIRYPDPLIKVHDSIRYDIGTGKILDFIKFETGNLCMVTGGHNLGRVGVITSRERHPGSFDIVHVKDSQGHTFATRYSTLYLDRISPQLWWQYPPILISVIIRLVFLNIPLYRQHWF